MNDPSEIFKTLNELVDGWCERRALCPLRQLLPAYPPANGLTDDWYRLYEALRGIRAFCKDDLDMNEHHKINQIIGEIQAALL